MKVAIIQRPAFRTDYRKKWLYESSNRAAYRFYEIDIPNCEIYHRRRLLGFVTANTLSIEPKYAFDGMTCWPDDAANLPWAILHDFLYQTGLLTRAQADKALRIGMVNHGAKWSKTVYAGVRMFGWLHYGKESEIRIVKS